MADFYKNEFKQYFIRKLSGKLSKYYYYLLSRDATGNLIHEIIQERLVVWMNKLNAERDYVKSDKKGAAIESKSGNAGGESEFGTKE